MGLLVGLEVVGSRDGRCVGGRGVGDLEGVSVGTPGAVGDRVATTSCSAHPPHVAGQSCWISADPKQPGCSG